MYLYLPVVKHAKCERLSLCVCAKISLKAERINSRNKSLDGVERWAWDWGVLRHMTSTGHKDKRSVTGTFQKEIVFISEPLTFAALSNNQINVCVRVYTVSNFLILIMFVYCVRARELPPACQHSVHGRNAVGRGLNLYEVIGLHQPGRGLQKTSNRKWERKELVRDRLQ